MDANMINRRRFLATAAVAAPTAALAGMPKGREFASRAPSYQKEWDELNAELTAVDKRWRDDELSDGQYEDLVDPIIDRKDDFEKRVFDEPSRDMAELRIKAEICKYYDWTIEGYNEILYKDVVQLTERMINKEANPA